MCDWIIKYRTWFLGEKFKYNSFVGKAFMEKYPFGINKTKNYSKKRCYKRNKMFILEYTS